MFWLGSSVLDEKVDRWVDGSVCVDNVVIMWIKKIDSKFRSIVNDQNRRKEFEKVELENLVIKSVVRSEGVRWDRLRLENLGRVGLIGSVYIKIKRKKDTQSRICHGHQNLALPLAKTCAEREHIAFQRCYKPVIAYFDEH